MAGLYDRIATNDDNINGHHFVAAMKAYAAGAWTRTTILDGINSLVSSELSQDAQDDLTAIADEIDAQATDILKLMYVNKIEAALIATEVGILPETNFRNILGLS